MSLPENMTVTLTLIDGTERKFTFEPPPGQEMRIAARVKGILKFTFRCISVARQTASNPKVASQVD